MTNRKRPVSGFGFRFWTLTVWTFIGAGCLVIGVSGQPQVAATVPQTGAGQQVQMRGDWASHRVRGVQEPIFGAGRRGA